MIIVKTANIRKIAPYVILLCVVIFGVFYYKNIKKEAKIDVAENNSLKENVVTSGDIKNQSSFGVNFPDLKLKKFFDNKVEILLPGNFEVMDELMAKLKYPLDSRPEIIYTDIDGKINVALKRTDAQATEADLPQLSQYFAKVFGGAKDFQSNEIITINGKKFIVIKMITSAIDTDVFNIMAMGIIDGKLLVISFNCTVGEIGVWRPIGEKIINSIKISD